MKKTAFTLLISLITIASSFAQIKDCIYCRENILGGTSSAIGEGNTNHGDLSLTIGRSNYIQKSLQTITMIGSNNSSLNERYGNYSLVLGNNNRLSGDSSILIGNYNEISGMNSFILGTHSQMNSDFSASIGYRNINSGIGSLIFGNFSEATNTYSTAIGMYAYSYGMASMAIGSYAETKKKFSLAIGNHVVADADYSIVLGGSQAYQLTNTKPYSLVVGFNSDLPTFFVSKSDGSGFTGKIGIGNITAPEAKLHILGDNDAARPDNASLYIQSAGNYYSTLWLGDTSHYIKTKPNENLVFRAAGKNFIFENGNVGIGTDEPGEKLEVVGNISALAYFGDGSALTGTGDNLGNHTATQNINLAGKYLSGDGQSEGVFVTSLGKVGIGTDDPDAELEVAGNISALAYFGDGSNLDGTGDNLGNHTMAQTLRTNGHWINSDTDEDQGIFIDGGGRVGIGTTQTNENMLAVAGDITATYFHGNGSQLTGIEGDNLGNHTMAQTLRTNGHWINSDTDEDQGIFIDGGGRVGIGTTQTNENMLAVAGDITATYFHGNGSQLTGIEGDNLGNHTMAQTLRTNGHWINSDTDEDQGIYIDGGGRVGIGTAQTDGNMLAVAGNISGQMINATGNVGIGTSTPETQLEVNGQSYNNWARFKTGSKSLNFGRAIAGESLGLWGSSYIGFNLYRAGDNAWKTETDGASNGGAMIFATSGGSIVFTCIPIDPNRVGIQNLNNQQIKDNTKMILRSDGLLKTNEVVVKTNVWSDYVFKDGYTLPDLTEVEGFINENKHLPDVPSEAEVIEEGINLGEMDAILLKKIEELTLYVIELKKENRAMREDIENLKK